MLRTALGVLLAAALIQLAPSPYKHVNKKIDQVARAQATVEAKTPAPLEGGQSQSEKKAEQVQVQQPAPAPQPVLNEHQQWMRDAGIAEADWEAVDYIISHESSWRPAVYNSEGCVGLGQRCPASTLLNVCPDLNPVCQLRHFTTYAVSRYGGWQNAASVWQSQRWW